MPWHHHLTLKHVQCSNESTVLQCSWDCTSRQQQKKLLLQNLMQRAPALHLVAYSGSNQVFKCNQGPCSGLCLPHSPAQHTSPYGGGRAASIQQHRKHTQTVHSAWLWHTKPQTHSSTVYTKTHMLAVTTGRQPRTSSHAATKPVPESYKVYSQAPIPLTAKLHITIRKQADSQG